MYQEALDTYRKLAQANPQAYLPAVAQTLNNLAILELAQDHIKPAQVLVSEALSALNHRRHGAGRSFRASLSAREAGGLASSDSGSKYQMRLVLRAVQAG